MTVGIASDEWPLLVTQHVPFNLHMPICILQLEIFSDQPNPGASNKSVLLMMQKSWISSQERQRFKMPMFTHRT